MATNRKKLGEDNQNEYYITRTTKGMITTEVRDKATRKISHGAVPEGALAAFVSLESVIGEVHGLLLECNALKRDVMLPQVARAAQWAALSGRVEDYRTSVSALLQGDGPHAERQTLIRANAMLVEAERALGEVVRPIVYEALPALNPLNREQTGLAEERIKRLQVIVSSFTEHMKGAAAPISDELLYECLSFLSSLWDEFSTLGLSTFKEAVMKGLLPEFLALILSGFRLLAVIAARKSVNNQSGQYKALKRYMKGELPIGEYPYPQFERRAE